MTAGAPPRSKRLARAEREQQILDAAVTVFSQRGYHGATVDDVAEQAGVSKPLVYLYLGAKEELFSACIRREAERLVATVAASLRAGPGPEEQLWEGFRIFLRYIAGHRDSWSVLYIQARAQGEPFAGEITEMRRLVVTQVGAMLSNVAASRRGRPFPTDETSALASALVGAAEAMAQWVLDHPEEDPDISSTRLMNLVWTGLGNAVDGNLWRAPTGGEDRAVAQGSPGAGGPSEQG